MVAVVAEIAVRQYDRMSARAYRQLPLMSHLTMDIYEVDMSIGRLGGDQCVAAGAQSAVMSNKTCAASALGDLVNGGSHGVLSVT